MGQLMRRRAVLGGLKMIAKPALVGSYTYNGTEQTPVFTYDSEGCTKGGTYVATNAGSYTAVFTLNRGYCWDDKSKDPVNVSWDIAQKDISGATITLGASLTYNGSAQTQSVSSVVIDSLTATYDVSDNTQTNAGSYTLTCTGNGNFTGTQTASWSIAQKSISGATVTLSATSKTYNGSAQSVSINSVVISGLSATFSTSGTTSATNVGTYTVTATGTGNFTGTASATWTMNKLSLTIPSLSNTSKTYNGSSQNPTINSFNSTYENQSGTTSSTNAGNFTITWSLKSTSNTQWTDGTTGNKTGSWSIAKATGSISTSTSSITLSGTSGKTTTFTFSRTGDGTLSVTSSNTSIVTVSGASSPVTVTLKGTGSATITVSQAAGTNYTAASKDISVSATVFVYKRVGGRIFYDAGSNGATYTFYDSSYNVLSTQTVSGLANAYYYTVSGTPSADRWYVYDTAGLTSGLYWGYYRTSCGVTSDGIGKGKTNTATVLTKGVPTDYTPNVWSFIKGKRDSSYNGCNDWFIASKAEQDQLRSSGLVTWYSSNYVWSSVEYSANNAYLWYYNNSYWLSDLKNVTSNGFAARAF